MRQVSAVAIINEPHSFVTRGRFDRHSDKQYLRFAAQRLREVLTHPYKMAPSVPGSRDSSGMNSKLFSM